MTHYFQIITTLDKTLVNELDSILLAGATSLRIDATQSDLREVQALIEIVRREYQEVPILLELHGLLPRINLPSTRHVNPEDRIDFALERSNDLSIHLPAPSIFAAARTGMTLLVGQPGTRIRIVGRSSDTLWGRALETGLMRSLDRVALLESPARLESVPDRDHALVDYAKTDEHILLVVPSAQCGEDFAELSRINPNQRTIARIQTAAGADALSALSHTADALWIDRPALQSVFGALEEAMFFEEINARELPTPVFVTSGLPWSREMVQELHPSEVSHLLRIQNRGFAGEVLLEGSGTGSNPSQLIRQIARLGRERIETRFNA